MLVIKGLSDKKCFICGSAEKTAEVQFADKTFRGVLCMTHVFEKLKQDHAESKGQATASTGVGR